MKIVLQRVRSASVTVDGEITGAIGHGVCLLVGIAPEDTAETLKQAVEKIVNLRIFPDEKGRFHFSLLDTGGGALLVPQFTLFGDCSKGRRPEFFGAAKPEMAEPMFAQLKDLFGKELGNRVGAGVFGAHMVVSIENDGPVTLMLEW